MIEYLSLGSIAFLIILFGIYPALILRYLDLPVLEIINFK